MRELDARANQLAHHLRARGVGPEVVVGLCIERSPEMIVGLLGILKAGGAYLPLDPAYPHERLAFMIEDAGAPVLVTQAQLRNRIPQHGNHIIRLDADAADIERHPTTAPANNLAPAKHRLCHLHIRINRHTKGVAVTHQNVTQLFGSTEHLFHFDANDVCDIIPFRCALMSRSGRFGDRFCIGGRLLWFAWSHQPISRRFLRLSRAKVHDVLNLTPSAFYRLTQAVLR